MDDRVEDELVAVERVWFWDEVDTMPVGYNFIFWFVCVKCYKIRAWLSRLPRVLLGHRSLVSNWSCVVRSVVVLRVCHMRYVVRLANFVIMAQGCLVA